MIRVKENSLVLKMLQKVSSKRTKKAENYIAYELEFDDENSMKQAYTLLNEKEGYSLDVQGSTTIIVNFSLGIAIDETLNGINFKASYLGNV